MVESQTHEDFALVTELPQQTDGTIRIKNIAPAPASPRVLIIHFIGAVTLSGWKCSFKAYITISGGYLISNTLIVNESVVEKTAYANMDRCAATLKTDWHNDSWKTEWNGQWGCDVRRSGLFARSYRAYLYGKCNIRYSCNIIPSGRFAPFHTGTVPRNDWNAVCSPVNIPNSLTTYRPLSATSHCILTHIHQQGR